MLGGAYYTALGIRESRAQQYLSRLTSIMALLATDSTPVRIAALRQLQAFALEEPVLPRDSITTASTEARKLAILGAIDAAVSDPAPDVRDCAIAVAKELRALSIDGLGPSAAA